MKPYGIPRIPDLDGGVDCIDGVRYGVKSSRVRCRGKGGDFKSSVRSSEAKRRNRRVWKKIERKNIKRGLLSYDLD